MAAVDAQFYWMSAKVPNDQFLLYAFDGEPTDLERAVAQVYRRARGCPGLGMRVQDRGALAYPQWVPTPVQRDQLAAAGPQVKAFRSPLGPFTSIQCGSAIVVRHVDSRSPRPARMVQRNRRNPRGQ